MSATPGNAAPDESRAVPEMEAETWARAGNGQVETNNAHKTKPRKLGTKTARGLMDTLQPIEILMQADITNYGDLSQW